MTKRSILMASAAALSMVQVASAADITIRITGSSAFRASTSNAILGIMTFPNAGMGYGYNGTNFTGATTQIFKGSVAGITGTVTVKTRWTGSVQGIRDVALDQNISVYETTYGGTTPVTLTSTGVPNYPGDRNVNEHADIVLADNTQGSTTTISPAIDVFNKVGIVPFAFVASRNVPAAVTNITAQQHKALVNVGSVPASLFTGVLTDTIPVYAVGRDTGSGTRLTALAETGYGTQSRVTQFVAGGTGTNGAVANDTVTTIAATANEGNEGETSGGTLANYLRWNTSNVADNFFGIPARPISFIGYLGETDSYAAVYGIGSSATSANAANARYLTYNGVAGFGGVASRQAITTTSGNATVTVPSTAGIIPGQIVSGTGVGPGAVVVSVNSATSLTLDKNSTATGTASNGQIGALLPARVRNGQYTFWNFEYLGYKTSTYAPNTDGSRFATALTTRIRDVDYSFSGLADDTSMKVTRETDGSPVIPNGN
jgi:hypothetical protein